MMIHDVDTDAPSSDTLRRSLDRAVGLARGGRLLAACGDWLTAAAVTVAALAAVHRVSGGRLGIAFLPPATKLAAILACGGIVAIVAFRRRLTRDGWPTRLDIALATESRRPVLGETLSRAVDFLESPPGVEHGGPKPPALQEALRQLAIDQAAAATRNQGGLVVPRFASDVGRGLAGLATALALWSSTLIAAGGWGDAVRRQLTPPPGPRSDAAAAIQPPDRAAVRTSATLPHEAVAAAGQLAAAAAVEQRLADVLAEQFSLAPGVPAESLDRRRRQLLEELAAIQAAALRAIDASGHTIRAAAAEAVPLDTTDGPSPRDRLLAACAWLERIDSRAAEASPGMISANRLHVAGTAAAALADAATAIASGLGAAPRDTPAVGTGPAADEESAGPLAGAAAALTRIAVTRAAGVGDATASAEGHRPGPPIATGSDASPSAAARPGGGSPGLGAAATVEPDGGRLTTAAAPGAEGEATPVERVWSRLPDSVRWQNGRAAVESAPPDYRRAIDAYYQLLLQSFSDPSPAAPP